MSKQITSPTEQPTTPVAWSSRLDIQHLGNGPAAEITSETGAERQQGSSKIEKEIIWAVVVLYSGLIACFAGLHIFGLTLG